MLWHSTKHFRKVVFFMSLGRILLLAVSVLVLFGVGQRVLDRMRLNDRQALLVIAAILVGGFLPSIPLGSSVSVNIGGALVPLGLCIYLFIRAGTAKERWRAVIASVLTAAAVLLMGRLLPDEPETMPFDVNYAYGIVAGIIAYLLGRSRICSFIAGVMGVLLADIAQAVLSGVRGVPVNLNLGGAGGLDAVVLSGFIAVLLSALVGTLIERATGKSERHARIVDGRQVFAARGKERKP